MRGMLAHAAERERPALLVLLAVEHLADGRVPGDPQPNRVVAAAALGPEVRAVDAGRQVRLRAKLDEADEVLRAHPEAAELHVRPGADGVDTRDLVDPDRAGTAAGDLPEADDRVARGVGGDGRAGDDEQRRRCECGRGPHASSLTVPSPVVLRPQTLVRRARPFERTSVPRLSEHLPLVTVAASVSENFPSAANASLAGALRDSLKPEVASAPEAPVTVPCGFV